MKKMILFLVLFCATMSYGQLKKVELTPEEVDFIAYCKNNPFAGGLSDEDFNKIMSLNNTIFIFEVIYKEKVLYTGTLNKWFYNCELTAESSRKSINFCFNYSDLDSDIIEDLLGTNNWKIEKISISKYMCCLNSYDLFILNNKRKFILNEVVKDKIKFKLYKLIE